MDDHKSERQPDTGVGLKTAAAAAGGAHSSPSMARAPEPPYFSFSLDQ
jgi:hypothetical protein